MIDSRTTPKLSTRLLAFCSWYPRIAICGAAGGHFTDEAAIVAKVATAAPDVLLVALGAPAQEAFIARNRQKLGTKVCIGVGGLFDSYSG